MRPDFDSEEIRSEVCEIVVFLAQASEFFMFGALMIVDMMIFGFMAYNYTYVNPNAVTDNDEKASNIDSGNIKDKDIELNERIVPDIVDNDEEMRK